MLVTAPSVDLNWFIQFIFTAFVIVVGLLYLVKNTASKYFLVDDANFEGGGVGSNGDSAVLNRSSERDRRRRMPGFPNAVPADVCVVCGGDGSKQCSGCKVARYCSGKCQSAHWHSGHKKTCKTTCRESKVSRALIKKILFPYDEFIRYFNWNNPGFPPCGLLNCGNSCFANVVLQCLSHTRPLVAYLLEKGHQQECRLNNWCFLCEFQTHVERGSKSLHSFSPMNILSRLPNIGGNLGHGKQEDAHEFMRFAIDTMQAVCLEEFGGEKAVHPSSQETTLIQHIFGGHLQSQVICTNCNKISNQYESMMDLTVEIHGDAASLEECLDQFTVKEWLHGDNMYKCDGCDDYVKAWKRLTVRQAPNILTIALKRFQSGRFGKLNKRVTFPETLDLSPYMTEAVTGADVYKLYAVVVHLDMLNASYFGHYICYIKDFSGNWYMIDDCKVVKVDLEDVLSEGAYMLLYSRVDARPSCLEPIEALRKEERLNVNVNVNVTPEIAASNPSPGDITASADPGVPDSPLEYSMDTEDVELECIGPKPLVSEEIETHSHANEDTLLSESEECHPKSGLDIDMLEEDINNGNYEEEVVSQNLPEHPVLIENGAHDNGRTADELLPNEGLQRSSCNGGSIEKFPNGNSSTQATLKPIFSSGFLDKHRQNKSMMSNGNSSQESRPKLSLAHEVEKNCNGSLNKKTIEINDQPNPHWSSNGSSSSASVHEQLQKCLNKVDTVEINSGESVKVCKGDVTSPNATVPTESIIPNDTESVITNDVKEKNKFCAQNQFNHSSIQQKC